LLIRLLDEEGQIVPADTFIRVAERVGLIHDIDRWMVKQAVALIARQRGEAPRLDVNVSGKAVSDSGLLTLIETELRRAKVDPSSLGIEITETAAIGDMAKARAFIDRLKDIGCRVTLDDFGSGFSSFYYLNSLPVDGLKIDGGFVRNMTASRRDQHVVRAIVELCRGFAIESTAEWVEDEATFEFLKEFGVTHAQGWALGRPVPVEEALGLSAEMTDTA
jgi:EAL domain-containing protein (putative c-di-GMP-specific phosphodiesterase class I)